MKTAFIHRPTRLQQKEGTGITSMVWANLREKDEPKRGIPSAGCGPTGDVERKDSDAGRLTISSQK